MVKRQGLVMEKSLCSKPKLSCFTCYYNSDYSADMKTKKKHKEDICDSIFLDLRDSKLKLV